MKDRPDGRTFVDGTPRTSDLMHSSRFCISVGFQRRMQQSSSVSISLRLVLRCSNEQFLRMRTGGDLGYGFQSDNMLFNPNRMRQSCNVFGDVVCSVRTQHFVAARHYDYALLRLRPSASRLICCDVSARHSQQSLQPDSADMLSCCLCQSGSWQTFFVLIAVAFLFAVSLPAASFKTAQILDTRD